MSPAQPTQDAGRAPDAAMTPQQLLERAPREYVPVRGVGQALWTLPQNLAIGLLRLYRRIISPLYGEVCRYFPSCSAYALESFTVHGAVRGLGLTMRRLLRCHPWASGGLDPVPAGPRTFAPGRAPQILLLNHPRCAHAHDTPVEPRG